MIYLFFLVSFYKWILWWLLFSFQDNFLGVFFFFICAFSKQRMCKLETNVFHFLSLMTAFSLFSFLILGVQHVKG